MSIKLSPGKQRTRIVGMYAFASTLIVTSLYLLFNIGALSSQSDTESYQTIYWDDLRAYQPGALILKPASAPLQQNANSRMPSPDAIEGISQRKRPSTLPSGSPANVIVNGANVRLAGYVVPLQDSPDHAITEFFLVPYVGACIHIPPPPPNQIVYISFPQGIRIDNVYQPYWVEGTIFVETFRSGLANTAFKMTADEMEIYDP